MKDLLHRWLTGGRGLPWLGRVRLMLRRCDVAKLHLQYRGGLSFRSLLLVVELIGIISVPGPSRSLTT